MPSNLGKACICLGLVLIFLGLIFIWQLPYAFAKAYLVRVAVVCDADQIKLSVHCPYQILALNTNRELHSGRRLWRGTIVATDNGIKIDQLDFKTCSVRIQPSRSPGIYVNGRRFRGAIDIIRQAEGTLIAINQLDVEEYVSGVLGHEVAAWWPMDALKAQAIVARSFALYQAKVNARKDYDLASTVYSQVYGGRTSEKGRSSQAVKATKGEVLSYQNKILPAFYHATCAGHTEAAKRLWKISLPPLRGRECKFCQRSPHFRWRKKVSLRNLEEVLEQAGVQVGPIESVQIVDRDVSGRITQLEITSKTGEVKVEANRFRLAVGPGIIRSTNFNVELNGKSASFSGYGWGHGVGMCQWGALFMSRKHFNTEQILDYYYPEAKIKQLDEIVDEQGDFKTF